MRVKRSSDKKLQNFKRTYRSESILLGAVERHVVMSSFIDPERNPSVIHPSEISHNDTCRRQIYYRIVGTPMEIDGIDTSFWRERIFEDGHESHTKWQGWLWDMGKLYGYFECLACDAYWYAHSPKVCFKCGAPRKKLKFREVPVESAEYMIGGLADGAVDEGLIEIKNIGKGTVRIEAPGFYDKFITGEWTEQQLWNEIKRPFPAHVRQGMIYCFCKGVSKVIFIYECKWNQAVKEFTVAYTEEVIAPVLEACLDIKYAVKKHRPLKRPRWADPTAAACKACPYRKTCWNGEVQDEAEGTRAADVAVEAPKKKWRVKVEG